MPYRLLEHTADLGVAVRADSLDELLAESVAALTDCLTRLERIEETESRSLELAAADVEQALVALLTEVVVLFETVGLVFAAAQVTAESDGEEVRLSADLVGEPFDLERHGLKTLIKAVTYHGLKIERVGSGWEAQIVFDI